MSHGYTYKRKRRQLAAKKYNKIHYSQRQNNIILSSRYNYPTIEPKNPIHEIQIRTIKGDE